MVGTVEGAADMNSSSTTITKFSGPAYVSASGENRATAATVVAKVPASVSIEHDAKGPNLRLVR